jgi:uncharacterized protein
MKFVCDMMLGKLAKYLRILGLDAALIKNPGEIEKLSGSPCPFLTRRTDLEGHEHVVFIRSDRPKEQLREIRDIIIPFIDFDKTMTRCIECNTLLKDIPKSDIEQYVPEFVFHRYQTFKLCPSCGKVYWEGTHAAAMTRFIEEVFGGRTVE